MTARWEGLDNRQGFWPDRLAGARTAPLAAQPSTPGLTGIGDTLRRAREERDITLDAAERDTRIPRHHLQALEDERFDSFQASVYLRGFLRSYSQYLGLNSGELLALLPGERSAEDDRLQPLSRLGRPRGPREAERERRDPLARGAAPLAYGSPDLDADDVPLGEPIPSRRGAPQREPPLRVVPRVDPLGRLGWPERPSDSSARETTPREASPYDAMLEEAGRVHAAERSRRSGRAREAGDAYHEQPLAARRPRHWAVSSRWRGLVPDDVRPFFQPEVLTTAGVAVAALFIVLILALALGGGDVSPTVAIAAATGASATVDIPAPAGAPVAHGSMPNVQGADVAGAVATLKASGVVPVLIGDTSGDLRGQRVVGQVPSAGSAVDAHTPVLLVAGSGS